jgi:hypothetical protein
MWRKSTQCETEEDLKMCDLHEVEYKIRLCILSENVRTLLKFAHAHFTGFYSPLGKGQCMFGEASPGLWKKRFFIQRLKRNIYIIWKLLQSSAPRSSYLPESDKWISSVHLLHILPFHEGSFRFPPNFSKVKLVPYPFFVVRAFNQFRSGYWNKKREK